MRYVVVAVLFISGAAVAADKKCGPGEARVVTVNAANDEWKTSDISVEQGDLVIIETTGEVTVGSWAGKTNADGTGRKSLGRLTIKRGEGPPEQLGANAIFFSKSSGELKLRVFDTDYSDNEGAFTVTVRRIPACAVPQPK